MNLCSCCRGRRQSQRPIPTRYPIANWPQLPDELVTVTFKTITIPCDECWQTGLGVNYRLVAVRPTPLVWMQTEIMRMLAGGESVEMELEVGTALNYRFFDNTLVGLTIGGERIETPYVDRRILEFLVHRRLPKLPEDWSIHIVPVKEKM